MWKKIKLLFSKLSPLMLEYLEVATMTVIQQILPIVLQIVIDLIVEKLTGEQKQKLAFAKIKTAIPSAKDDDVNNAIEIAYKIAVGRGLVPGECPDGKCV